MSSLVTNIELKQVPELSGLADSVLTNLGQAATARVERECERSFSTSTRTEIYDGDGMNSLLLDNFPVSSVAEVIVTDTGGNAETIAGSYFKFNVATGELWFDPAQTSASGHSRFALGRQNISVEYISALSNEHLELIKDAVRHVARFYHLQLATQGGVVSEWLGEYKIQYAQSAKAKLPDAAADALSTFRDRKMR